MTTADYRLQCAYRCAAEAVRARQLSGAAVEPWLRWHFDDTDAAIRKHTSARGHESCWGISEPDTLSSMQVAQLIGRNDRWVRRHRDELGGIQQGDRWRFPRTAVEHWKENH
ncbi:helix-turn-helix domain-containing protein [Mycobacterium sp. HUMS_1102779]|uniref:helix-turn-helix domain-containing protein n=1 Tax=Mycobacterium sp. HUMS_1102779 TaxID=3383487 RepID=UPI00389AB666